MDERKIISRINTDFNNKVRRKTLWSRTELFELHRNVCDMYLNPIKRKNLAMIRSNYDDIN
mgnify:FL=1|tara:strand:- start:6232 stop:6414 length:183 start_codon:yes stop_codon:yes gene_type:complete